MSLGIVITAKNESRIIRKNILYHKYLGVDRFFLYFDNSTDSSNQSVADLNYVEVSNSVESNIYNQYDQLTKFVVNYDDHHTARQCLNTFDALQKCRSSGLKWLISIDADELVFIDKNLVYKNQLCDFFNALNPQTEAIIFRTYEAMQKKVHYENVFKEETLFKSHFTFDRRFDRLRRTIEDPFLNIRRNINFWYGQHDGKMAIKVSVNAIPKNVHRFECVDSEKLNTIFTDGLLHYHAYDFDDFVKKFKNFENRPDTFLTGNKIEYAKKLWRDVVNKSGMNETNLLNYYRENIMFEEKWIKSAMRKRRFGVIPRKQIGIEEIQIAKTVFDQIDKEESANL